MIRKIEITTNDPESSYGAYVTLTLWQYDGNRWTMPREMEFTLTAAIAHGEAFLKTGTLPA